LNLHEGRASTSTYQVPLADGCSYGKGTNAVKFVNCGLGVTDSAAGGCGMFTTFTVSKLEPDVTDEDIAAEGCGESCSFNNSKVALDIVEKLNAAGGWGTSATFTV